jgi:hypothetical protein
VAEEDVEGSGAGWYMARGEAKFVMMWIDFLQSACDLRGDHLTLPGESHLNSLNSVERSGEQMWG